MNPSTLPANLDGLHVVLIGLSAVISVLFSIVVFFIGRDFKARDEREKMTAGAMAAMQASFVTHEGRLATVESRAAQAESRADKAEEKANNALNATAEIKGMLKHAS